MIFLPRSMSYNFRGINYRLTKMVIHLYLLILRALCLSFALLEKLLSAFKSAPKLSYRFGAETFTHF